MYASFAMTGAAPSSPPSSSSSSSSPPPPPPPPPPSASASASAPAPEAPSEPAYYDVAVVGAGVAGLTLAAALHQQRLSVRVLERRADAAAAHGGADVALWPGAISLLKMLGVSHSFFQNECFPVDTVHMCKLDFDRVGERDAAHVLNTVRMDEVTAGSGERFVLVGRERLMSALKTLVPAHVVVYGVSDVQVHEQDELSTVQLSYSVAGADGRAARSTIASRVAVGADGARSTLRAHVAADAAHTLRYCGEVCYRGVLHMTQLANEVREQVRKLLLDDAKQHTMRICYGAGLRASFGYMSADEREVYWWVKQVCDEAAAASAVARGAHHDGDDDDDDDDDNDAWPRALRVLRDATAARDVYVQRIEDSAELRKWSTPRVVLVGDAAHVLSPNMGQGACLAVEDAVELGTQLGAFWAHDDGHVEAFYQFELVRKPFVAAMARESRRQLALGQLRWRPAVTLRDAALRLVPARVLQGTLRRGMFDVAATRERFATLVAKR